MKVYHGSRFSFREFSLRPGVITRDQVLGEGCYFALREEVAVAFISFSRNIHTACVKIGVNISWGMLPPFFGNITIYCKVWSLAIDLAKNGFLYSVAIPDKEIATKDGEPFDSLEEVSKDAKAFLGFVLGDGSQIVVRDPSIIQIEKKELVVGAEHYYDDNQLLSGYYLARKEV